MPILADNQHEAFAQAVASGESNVSAYRKAFGCSQKTAESNACRMRENAGVVERIKELQAKAGEKAEITRVEILADLVEILHAPPCEANSTHRLCELKMSKAGEYYAFPEKLRAADMICKILGFYEEDKTKGRTADSLESLVTAIREGGGTGIKTA